MRPEARPLILALGRMERPLGKCAYCGRDRKSTREHIVPAWYARHEATPDDIIFMENVPHRFLSTDAVIRDVCEECNSTSLAALDSYGHSLYDAYFKRIVFTDETVAFSYEYDTLVKWLIKVSYNSARAHKSDTEILGEYASLICSESPLPANVIVYCALIAPANTSDAQHPMSARRSDDSDLYMPEWFRVGVFRVPKFDSLDWCFRSVVINSYAFLLCIPRVHCTARSIARLLHSSDGRATLSRAITISAVSSRSG